MDLLVFFYEFRREAPFFFMNLLVFFYEFFGPEFFFIFCKTLKKTLVVIEYISVKVEMRGDAKRLLFVGETKLIEKNITISRLDL